MFSHLLTKVEFFIKLNVYFITITIFFKYLLSILLKNEFK